MPVQSNHKIKSIVLVASVAVLALVFGVLLDGNVMQKDKQPLSLEETDRKDKTPIAATDSSQPSGIESEEQQTQQQSKQMKELDIKTEATMVKAEELAKQADQLVSENSLQQPTKNKPVAPDSKKVAKRLADVRSRLDALKK